MSSLITTYHKGHAINGDLQDRDSFSQEYGFKRSFFLLNRIQRIFLKESKLSEINAFILMVVSIFISNLRQIIIFQVL